MRKFRWDRVLKLFLVLLGISIFTFGFYGLGHLIDFWSVNPHIATPPTIQQNGDFYIATFTESTRPPLILQYWCAGISSVSVIFGGLCTIVFIVYLFHLFYDWLYPKTENDVETHQAPK